MTPLPPRREKLAAALLLAFAAVRMLPLVARVAETPRDEYCREESDFHVEHGEALLHGVPLRGVARAMPSYSVADAVVCNHLSRAGSAAVRSAVLASCAGLVFILGAELYSVLCGALAAVLFTLSPPPSGQGGERWLYVLAVLLAAYAVVRRAKRPSAANGVLLGAACGASLLVLPPLFLFPILLYLYERARGRRTGGVPGAAALVLLPFAFLIPWMLMNWRLSGRLVLFEDGRADENIITGALGLVRADERSGDYRALAGIPADRGVLAWAAGEILRHPAAYLAACASRLAFAARLQPLLVLGAAVSIRLAAKREEARQLALLAAYLIAIHCLMPVMPGYFAPVWPLLAVLGAGSLAAWTRPAAARFRAASFAAAGAIFAASAAAQLGVLGLVWSYPARAAEPHALDRELAGHPRDPWLWSERGMGLLRAGRPAEAARDLARSYALDPGADRGINHAWALLARGGPAARIWERRHPSGAGMSIALRERVLRAIYLALDGRRAAAAAAVAEAGRDARSAAGSPLPQIAAEALASWPPDKRRRIAGVFAGAAGFDFSGGPKDSDMLLDMAAGAPGAGPWRGALEELRRDPERMRRLALAYRDSGDYARALDAMTRARPDSRDAPMLLRMASDAGKAGLRRTGLDILARAESLPLDAESLGAAAGLSRELGDARGAGRLDLRLRAGAGARLARAEAAAAAGDRAAAAALLAGVSDAGLVDEEARRLVLAYQGIGEYRAALKIADRRAAARPGDARWRSDRGVLYALLGEEARAAADWTAALALDPELAEARRSLASLKAARAP